MKSAILLLVIAASVTVQAQFNIFDAFGRFQESVQNLVYRIRKVPYKLCTYDEAAYAKCDHTVELAKKYSINLPLECVKSNSRNGCFNAMRSRQADMVVLSGHFYEKARSLGFEPKIFERDSNESLYIVVAPKDIKLTSINEASIIVDQTNHRAFHAATFFNLRRGHDICLFWNHAGDIESIKIEDSSQYTPTEDEILLCPDLSYAFPKDYKNCNFEAGLQRAVFMHRFLPNHIIADIKKTIFDTLLQNFSQKAGVFNFFGIFEGKDNVIFKNNTIAFDLQPTYRNGVTEKVFNQLHCKPGNINHDRSQLE